MRDKANKALSRSTVRRIAIEEEEEDEGDQDAKAVTSSVKGAVPSRVAPNRTKIEVVEDSGTDSEDGGDVPARSDQKVVSPTSPLPDLKKKDLPIHSESATMTAPASTSAKVEKKIRIPVVEDSDSSSDGEVSPVVVATSSPSSTVASTNVLPSKNDHAPIPSSTPLAIYQPTLSPEQQAAKLKDEGNRFFSVSDFPRATQCYKQALALDPANALLYANMAISKLRAGDARGCLLDASIAVSLDPSYHKAMHRRAMAKRSLGLFQAARDDLKIAHDLLPLGHKDRAALAEEMLAVITDMVEEEKKKKEQERAAAAASKKVAHYKGGVTIEEEVEPVVTNPAGGMTPAQVKKVENNGAETAIKLKRDAIAIRQKWEGEEALRKEAWDQAQAIAAPPQPPQTEKQSPSSPDLPNAVSTAPSPSSTSTSAPANPATATAPPPLAPDVMDNLRLQGNDLFKKGDSRGAIELYEQCLRIDPSSVSVHANLALAKVRGSMRMLTL